MKAFFGIKYSGLKTQTWVMLYVLSVIISKRLNISRLLVDSVHLTSNLASWRFHNYRPYSYL